MQDVNKSVLMVNGNPAKYNRVYYQFKALRIVWMKSSSPNKDMYIQALTESMKEVIELYNLENDALADLQDWKDIKLDT